MLSAENLLLNNLCQKEKKLASRYDAHHGTSWIRLSCCYSSEYLSSVLDRLKKKGWTCELASDADGSRLVYAYHLERHAEYILQQMKEGEYVWRFIDTCTTVAWQWMLIEEMRKTCFFSRRGKSAWLFEKKPEQ